jgi:transcriptional regulator with XRE-family HTH domain
MIRALRAARLEAGLTLQAVALQLGRPISFVSKAELGERRLDPVDLWRFAHVYGRSVLDFLPTTPPDPPPRDGEASTGTASIQPRAPRR